MNYRDTLLTINMDNAFNNINKVKSKNLNKKVKAVVKANAYGHGLVGFSYILEKYEMVDSFCVSNLDEALALRVNGLQLPILVLGAIDSRHFEIALKNDISVTVYSKEVAFEAIEFNKPLKIQFKIDTAMNRLGFVEIDEFKKIYNKVINSNLIVEGIFSHFCSAEDDDECSLMQIEKFKKFIELVPKNIEIHIQNSAGAINYPNLDFVNAIRLGIGMYGCNPIDEDFLGQKIELSPLITLQTRVVMIKEVQKDETVSYNRTYKLGNTAKIATVPIGYADGFKLIYNNLCAYIDIGGSIKKYQIRGKVCMDQLMIEVDDNVHIGDYVTFIGDEVTVDDISKKCFLTKYEILTSLSERLYKVYKHKGEIIYEDNQILKV